MWHVVTRLLALPVAYVLARRAARALVSSRRFQFFGGSVRRVDTRVPVVALTLDDGPHPRHCQELLDLLRDRSVRATFFVVGKAAERAPHLLAAIVADGHELGNHSYSHRRLVLRSSAELCEEVERTDAVIRSAGQGGPIAFRPPYCAKLVALPRYLSRTGRRTVLWDVEPDSSPAGRRKASDLLRSALAATRPGSIILLHPMNASADATRQALPWIIDGLHDRGFRFVTVTELLALESPRAS